MNLAIDVRSLNTPVITGVGRYLIEMLKALLYIPHEDLESISSFSFGKKIFNSEVTTLIKGTRTNHTHIALPNKLLNAANVLNRGFQIRKIVPHADYVWLPNMLFYNVRNSPPYALTVHDLSFLTHPEYYSRSRRLWHSLVNLKRLIYYADRIIAVSNHTAADLHALMPDSRNKPLTIIMPGIDHIEAAPDGIEKKIPLDLAKESYILFLGTLEPRKNILAVINAYQHIKKKFPELKLIIAGHYGWSSRSVVTRIELDPSIIWLQNISEDYKYCLYQNASLFIWPSLYEGFGFPPIEALHYGTPVISSYRTSLPEVLANNAHYCNPYNYKELSKLIEQILADKYSFHVQKQIQRTWGAAAEELVRFLTQK